MTQPRLESLMFATVERDITLKIKDEDLVAKVGTTKGRMLLG